MIQPDASEALSQAISAECARLSLVVSPEVAVRLAAYASSLWQWNERLNLTRHTDVEKFVSRDVADAVAICPHLATGERVLDVGTGGGVPGAPPWLGKGDPPIGAPLKPPLARSVSGS